MEIISAHMMLANRPLRLLPWIIAVVLLTTFSYRPCWSATAESKYYSAERCSLELHKSPRLQKYRDRWLKCIRKYLAVYRHDPHGPWAAAGLYQAGVMYGELYKRSFLEADRREAIDLLDNVTNHFSGSRYRDRARKASDQLRAGRDEPTASARPDNGSTAKKWFEKAQANDRRLQQKTDLQKYRDQWLKSINDYRKAIQADPEGALAPASLYGMGAGYAGLYKWSRKDLDRLQSQKSFQEVIDRFPQSPFAAKAREELGTAAYGQGDLDGGDDIAGVIQSAAAETGPEQSASQEISPEQTAMVEGLRFWSNPRYTRVVIDANADAIFTYHELREDPAIGKPQRIYIDVHNSRLSQNLQKIVPINDDLLSDARAGQYTADTVRVVVDIKSSKTFKIFSLKNPFRIVLDVWGVDVDTASVSVAESPEAAPGGSSKLPQSAIVKQLALGVKRIVVDPGHGGRDHGAPGYYKGVSEKKVALQIGKRLAEKIRSQLKCDVVMTRDSDTYLSLEERTAIANTKNADLFISIHTNASPDHRAYGIETFILNLATDDESILVAARENATSTKNISDLDSILQDLMQNAKVSESTRLASYVLQGTYGRLRKKYDRIRNKGVKKAPFYVLLGAQMPSILVETSFISNARECKRLTDATYQDHLCQGIVDGIKRYIEETNPMALSRPAGQKEEG